MKLLLPVFIMMFVSSQAFPDDEVKVKNDFIGEWSFKVDGKIIYMIIKENGKCTHKEKKGEKVVENKEGKYTIDSENKISIKIGSKKLKGYLKDGDLILKIKGSEMKYKKKK